MDARSKSRSDVRIAKTWLALLCLLVVPPAAAGGTAGELVEQAGRALEAGDLAGAELHFAEARDLSPELALPWLGLAEIREREGELVAALELARRGRQLAPGEPEAALLVGRLLARLGAVPEALRELERARELAPGDGRAYLLAAVLLRDADRAGDAVGLLERGVDLGLNQPQVFAQLGLLLLAEGRPAGAREVAEAALGRHPRHGSLHLLAGLALAADPERRAEAVARLEEALELGVDEPGRVHLELGALLAEQSRPAEAREHLEQAASLLPDSPEIHYRLAAALRLAGDATGARAAAARFSELSRQRDAAERQAKEIGAILNEIQSLATANRLPEALERLEALLRDHPDDDRALTLESKVLFSMGRRREALATVARARELAPGKVEPHYLEGLFSMHLGRRPQSEAALRRALAIDPSLEQARKLLARLETDSAPAGEDEER